MAAEQLKRRKKTMYEWHRQIQRIVDEIDRCIQAHDDEALTLRRLSGELGYSEFHTTRKFREISACSFGTICGGGSWPLR